MFLNRWEWMDLEYGGGGGIKWMTIVWAGEKAGHTGPDARGWVVG